MSWAEQEERGGTMRGDTLAKVLFALLLLLGLLSIGQSVVLALGR